jgi:hypothetical protein
MDEWECIEGGKGRKGGEGEKEKVWMCLFIMVVTV